MHKGRRAGMLGPFQNPVALMNKLRFMSMNRIDLGILRKSRKDGRFGKFRIADSDVPYVPARGTISVYIEVFGATEDGLLEVHMRLTDHSSDSYRVGTVHDSEKNLTKKFLMEDVNFKILVVGDSGIERQWGELDYKAHKEPILDGKPAKLAGGSVVDDPAYYISESDAEEVASSVCRKVMDKISEFLWKRS